MQQANGGLCSNHFYPRPPRGGRPGLIAASTMLPQISIHALREEGDPCLWSPTPWQADFYPRPPRGGRLSLELETDDLMKISIHALREEGDRKTLCNILWKTCYFYPRPPRGGRPFPSPQILQSVSISIHALREEGDQTANTRRYRDTIFLSTPSARRATSIRWSMHRGMSNFYPRPPRGGRHINLL